MLTPDQVKQYKQKYAIGAESATSNAPISDFLAGFGKEAVRSLSSAGAQNAGPVGQAMMDNAPVFKSAIKSLETATQPTNQTQKLGSTAEKVAEMAVPFSGAAAKKAVELATKIKTLTNPKIISDAAKDILPTASGARDRFLANGLRLAPVEDISTIEQATGNNIGDFMSKFNLIKDTPEETTKALSAFSKQNYHLTRDAVSLVDDKFTFQDLPELKSTIDFLKKDLAGRSSPEYKQALQHLIGIEKNGSFELTDAQYVKSLFDDVESVYKKTGDVRDAVQAQDKANTISHVRRFIEDRVQEVYPEVDLRSLNNNTQTSRALMDAIVKRSNKADTASLFQLGDMAVLGIGEAQAPGAGYAALFAKKIVNSSPILLRLSRYFGKKAGTTDDTKNLTDVEKLITSELEKAMKEQPIEIAK